METENKRNYIFTADDSYADDTYYDPKYDAYDNEESVDFQEYNYVCITHEVKNALLDYATEKSLRLCEYLTTSKVDAYLSKYI